MFNTVNQMPVWDLTDVYPRITYWLGQFPSYRATDVPYINTQVFIKSESSSTNYYALTDIQTDVNAKLTRGMETWLTDNPPLGRGDGLGFIGSLQLTVLDSVGPLLNLGLDFTPQWSCLVPYTTRPVAGAAPVFEYSGFTTGFGLVSETNLNFTALLVGTFFRVYPLT